MKFKALIAIASLFSIPALSMTRDRTFRISLENNHEIIFDREYPTASAGITGIAMYLKHNECEKRE